MSRAEKIGFFIMWVGLPMTYLMGWWAFVFAVVGAVVLFTGAHRRMR
jgi:tellurite resistance protein TehA-like permease